MLKKILLAALSLVMSLGVLTGCGAPDPNSEYSNRPYKVTLSYVEAGYGREHYEKMAKDFMDNYNQDIYLSVKTYTHTGNIRSLIQTGEMDGDIVQVSVDMYGYGNSLEDLTDLFERVPAGETLKIKEKNPQMYDYYREGTKIYQMAETNNSYVFAYNKTTLDTAFASEGTYTLPRTTDEFFAFGDALTDEGVYLTSAAISDTEGGDYLQYLYPVWFAQLEGIEGYNKFFAGEIYDSATSSYKLDDGNELKIFSNNREQIIDTYALCDRLLRATNNYLHPASRELDYMDNNMVFGGSGYGSSRQKTAFLYIGPWYETEIQPLIQDELVDAGQEYGAMRVPVASSLVKYLEYRNGSDYMTDAMLSDVIKTVDEGGTSYTGVTANDFARIKEARKMGAGVICSEFVVPKTNDSVKKENVFKVLEYLASDRAQEVCANAIGGLSLMSFGNPPATLSITPTNFINEYNTIYNDPERLIVDFARLNTLASKHLKHSYYHVPGGSKLSAYVYTENAPQTAVEMYDALVAKNTSTWATYITNYKTALGINN